MTLKLLQTQLLFLLSRRAEDFYVKIVAPLKNSSSRFVYPGYAFEIENFFSGSQKHDSSDQQDLNKKLRATFQAFISRMINMKIITNKVIIPQEVPLVCRKGLLDTLQENLNSCQATVINGRAGTGKSMLAADFVRRHAGRAAWYKVDAPDISLSVFMEYMVASVARVRPDFGSETLACQLQLSGEFNIPALAEAYVYDLERQAGPLILVIDDLHLIYDADWLVPFFHRLLPLMPADIHMLILGRGLPPAPLWRLRSKQRLFVITEQMLAFTQPESEELFFGYGLSAEDARVALKQTGGRAADLHEAAIRASEAFNGAGATCMLNC